MLSERTIINGLIIIGGLILGPYLIILTFEFNQVALLAFVAVVFLFFAFFFFRDRMSTLPFLGARFSGKLNFLPFGLMPLEICCLTTILYYVIHYIMLKRRPIYFGPLALLAPLLVIGAIVLYHDHKLGLQALGGGDIGARRGVDILLVIVTYICAINIPTASVGFLRWLPVYGFAISFLGNVPFVLTTYFPSTAPYLYYVSSNVNIDAYVASVGGTESEELARNGAILSIAAPLQALLVTYFPISTWWRPSRWPIAVLSAACIFGVLMGGFRNAFLSTALVTLLATIAYSRWRVLAFAPLLVIVPLVLLYIQNNHPMNLTLPRTVQRAMSFIPAKWDSDVVLSAASSNDFRAEVARIYKKEYLHKSPWIGNGFSFNLKEVQGLEAESQMPGVSDSQYFFTKSFVVAKLFHVGWISLYDAVGIIGGIAFVFLNVTVVIIASWHVFHRGSDSKSPLFPLKVSLFAGTTTSFIGYFTTFGSFNDSVVGICTASIILIHLGLIEKKNTPQSVSASPQKQLNLPHRNDPFLPAPSA